MKACEVNHIATGAAYELRQPAKGRDNWIIERALASVDGLIAKVARPYCHGTRDLRDAQQNARLALLEALPGYDKSKGCFSTFATFIIRKSIQKGFNLSGRKAGTKKEQAQANVASLDAIKDSQKEDKGSSLYEKLADTSTGEDYTIARLDGAKAAKQSIEFAKGLKKDFYRDIFWAMLNDESVADVAIEQGYTKARGYQLAEQLSQDFAHYAAKH